MPKTDFEKRGPVQSPGSGFYIDGTEVVGNGDTWGMLMPQMMIGNFSVQNTVTNLTVPIACRLTRIRSVASADPGADGVITILKNGSATSHTLTTTSSSAATDDSGAISSGTEFAAGDVIGVKNTTQKNGVVMFVHPELQALG